MPISSKKEEFDAVGEGSKVCSHIVLKCLYFCTHRQARHFYGLRITWQKLTPKGIKHVSNAWPDELPTSISQVGADNTVM